MAVGDVSLGWEAGRRIVRRGPHVPWTRVADKFARADLVVANLECTISNRGTRWPTKNITIRAPLAAADSLVAGGIDVVSLANNHALDYGFDAFKDTLRLLDERGIGHAGGGRDSAAAHAPLMVEIDGLRIAFLGYVMPFSSRPSFNTRDWAAGPTRPGLAIGTADVVGREVTKARTQADVVVVMVHGGFEYSHRPSKRQRAIAKAAVDAGAALVIGHHPHVLQGYHHGNGTFVAYSLGNFVFDRFEGDANDTAILDVTLSADGVTSFRWIPIVIERGFPRPAVGAEIPRVLAKLPEL